MTPYRRQLIRGKDRVTGVHHKHCYATIDISDARSHSSHSRFSQPPPTRMLHTCDTISWHQTTISLYLTINWRSRWSQLIHQFNYKRISEGFLFLLSTRRIIHNKNKFIIESNISSSGTSTFPDWLSQTSLNTIKKKTEEFRQLTWS